MKSKKKLIVALSSFAFVLVAAVVTVTAVLAAATQSVTSNVTVRYSAKQVAGTVSATYQVGSAAAVDMTTDGTSSGSKTITYNGNETSSDPRSLSPLAVIDLGNTTATKDGLLVGETVTFTFTFTNTGSAEYKATVSYEGTEKNVEVAYDEDLTAGDNDTHYIVVPAYNTETQTAGSVTVTITVTVVNVALNAEFAGDFGWALAAL